MDNQIIESQRYGSSYNCEIDLYNSKVGYATYNGSYWSCYYVVHNKLFELLNIKEFEQKMKMQTINYRYNDGKWTIRWDHESDISQSKYTNLFMVMVEFKSVWSLIHQMSNKI